MLSATRRAAALSKVRELPSTLWAALSRVPPRAWLLLLLVIAIEVVYVFIVSAGRMTDWPTYLTFLDDQAEGFRQGHLHMAVEPDPRLLAQPNPFDPRHRPLWYWDASLYKGHYYLYWGPVPALLLAAAKTMARMRSPVGDQHVVFALASLQLVTGALLISRAQRRLFPGLPAVFVVMAIVAFGVVNPTLYNLARGGVYEAAIVGGHAFIIAGLLAAFEAVWRIRGGRDGRLSLGLAGGCWALAIGCRASIAPAIAVLIVATAWASSAGGPGPWGRRLRTGLWLGVPVALGVAGLLAYNRARFDSWFDFGWDHQLTWIRVRMSWAFFPANALSYALRPFIYRCKFPFLFATPGMEPTSAFPRWYRAPEGYGVWEQLTGFIVAVPWSWLAPVAAVAVALYGWRRLRRKNGDGQQQEARTVTLIWLASGSLIAASLPMLVLMKLMTGTMRYLGDGAGALALAGTLGAWLLYWRFRSRVAVRRTIAAVCGVLVLATFATSIALAIEGQYEHFRHFNPALLDKLENRFSVCGR